MAGLHGWAGLLAGWLLFLIFLFGTAAFFRQEISGWMRPELVSRPVTREALDKASRHLADKASNADRWTISLPPGRGGEALTLSWTPGPTDAGAAGNLTFDPASGNPLVIRETQGGEFLYGFHFDLYALPGQMGRYIVCIAALAMLVVIVSGVVTHKKLFADFFLLRLGKGQLGWTDAHKMAGVLALPFHAMIAYTGLVTLLFTIMPWAISAHFPSRGAFLKERGIRPPAIEVAGTSAAMLPLSALSERARGEWQGEMPRFIAISNPGDAAAMAELWPHDEGLGGPRGVIRLSATDGEPLQSRAPQGGATKTHQAMIDLHAGRFADPVLRWLYYLSGIGGTAMIASGLVLWTVKRRAKLSDPERPHLGFRLVERLNMGVIAGAPAGIAAYFLANRLLPRGFVDRAGWEITSLFIVWGGVFVWTLARPARRAWVEALTACATLYALVPVVNALTTTRGLIASLIARDWLFVGFDLMMLAIAAVCAFAARQVVLHQKAIACRKDGLERPA